MFRIGLKTKILQFLKMEVTKIAKIVIGVVVVVIVVALALGLGLGLGLKSSSPTPTPTYTPTSTHTSPPTSPPTSIPQPSYPRMQMYISLPDSTQSGGDYEGNTTSGRNMTTTYCSEKPLFKCVGKPFAYLNYTVDNDSLVNFPTKFNFDSNLPIIGPGNETVANNWNDFINGKILNDVVTPTFRTGTQDNNCADWQSNNPDYNSMAGTGFNNQTLTDCQQQLPFMCMCYTDSYEYNGYP